jgi:hypothetical protein
MPHLFDPTNFQNLNQILSKVETLAQQQTLLRLCLEPRLAPHVSVANYREGLLILACDSAAWATELRYQIPTLMQQLKRDKQFSDLKKIEQYVEPRQIKPPHQKVGGPQKISNEAADSLRAAAKDQAHPGLKQALLNLANHAARGY